jgi:bacterioferritin-associated ferredoxin
MIVCHCRVVTDRDVDAALAAGAATVGAVCRASGAAQDCGACIFSVKRLVGQRHSQQCAQLQPAVQRATIGN